MKRIFFNSRGGEGGHKPFWAPFGVGGWLGRLLLFLVLLFIFLFLLSFFHRCDSSGERLDRDDIPEDILNPVLPPDTVGGDPISQFPDPDYPGQLPDPGENLPDPGRNRLEPIDSTHIDLDSIRQTPIQDNVLNVIINDKDADPNTIRKWADEFKQLYPGPEYQVVYYNTKTMLIQIRVPENERQQIKQKLPTQITDIKFKVFDNSVFQGTAYKPNDPAFGRQVGTWYFDPIQAFDAWEITKGDPDITVAVVDSYFDMKHPEFGFERMVMPYSVPMQNADVNPSPNCPKRDPFNPLNPYPPFFHGSSVLSMAAGKIDNSIGASGIAPECKIMPISLGDMMTTASMIEGVLYAINQGADVINVSIGTAFPESVKFLPIDAQVQIAQNTGQDEEEVWDYVFEIADERNVTIVWAAGNSSIYQAMDPSKRDGRTIIVAALDHDINISDFSNFGNIPEYNIYEATISAPGVDIFGAMPYNTFTVGPGTSYAAPLVAGAVALMKSLNRDLTNAEVIEILQETGKPLPDSPTIGPMLQIRDALERVKNGNQGGSNNEPRGRYVKIEDVIKDNTKILGTWVSTEKLNKIVGNRATGEQVWQYFDFTSPTTGILRIKEDSGPVYTAPLTVKYGKNRITITMTQPATCPGKTDPYDMTVFSWVPDKNGLMATEHSYNGNVSQYLMKKIK